MTMDPDMMLTYLDFVEKRHRVWEARQAGAPQEEWTDDPILASRKFTNVYRVLDPGSQYVLRMVDDATTPRTALARAFLYRYTNRPGTWDYLRLELGHWPTAHDIWENDDDITHLLQRWRDWGEQVFSGAYMILPEPGVKGTDKVVGVVAKTRQMLQLSWPAFSRATTMAERHAALRMTPAVGDFMAMQILTDFGYSRHGQQDEDEFVVLGPGSTKGLKELGMPTTVASIDRCQQFIHTATEVRLEVPDSPFYRMPSRMDTQNTLCEFSKYVRFMRKEPAARAYRPAHPGPQPAPVLPNHW